MELTTDNGYIFTIDDEDYDKIRGYHWMGWRQIKNGKFYTTYIVALTSRKDGKRMTIRLHRILTNAPHGVEVDHADGDGLNNCKLNLRICTHKQNQANKGRQGNNTSGSKGVTRNSSKRKSWRAEMAGRHLGSFVHKEEAAEAYACAAEKEYGEFAKT